MIFYGVLRKLVHRWCGDTEGTLQNDLIGGEGGIVSAEPAVRMQRLAALAARRPGAAGAADRRRRSTRSPRPRRRAPGIPRASTARISTKFGDRTVNELKLESATLHDDPLPLFRARRHAGAAARRRDRGYGDHA